MESSVSNKSSLTADLEMESAGKPTTRFFQIDFMKTMMIFLVIMDHSFTHKFLHQYGSTFWERISIPLFMIIMGFNLGTSFKTHGISAQNSLRELYTKEYFQKKFQRYLIPYLFLYFIHGIIRMIVYFGNISVNGVYYYDQSDLRFLGYTFFYGPGLWFIPVLFGTILVFPAIYYFYQQAPGLTLIGTYFVELMTHFLILSLLIIYQDIAFPISFLLYSVFSMLSAIGLGLWISGGYQFKNRRVSVIYFLFPLSLGYMILYTIYYNSNSIFFAFPLGDYHLFFFPYSAFILVLAMNLLPETPHGKFADLIRTISKSTYHILLTQIFYFSIVYQFFLNMYDGIESTPDVFDGAPLNYLWYFPLNVLVTFTIGVLWKRLEDQFMKKAKKVPRSIEGKILKNLTKISYVTYVLWLIGPLLYFIVQMF